MNNDTGGGGETSSGTMISEDMFHDHNNHAETNNHYLKTTSNSSDGSRTTSTTEESFPREKRRTTTPTTAATTTSNNDDTKNDTDATVTITLHLQGRTTTTAAGGGNNNTTNNSSRIVGKKRQQQQQQPLNIVMVIPVSSLEQREVEMKQTARLLGIPAERWSGSLLYNEYHNTARASRVMKQQKPKQKNEALQKNGGNAEYGDNIGASSTTTSKETPTTVKIALHPDRDSNTLAFHQWTQQQQHQQSDSSPNATTAAAASSLSVFDWIQAYYVTGTLSVPRHARGYELLAAVEYFSILYQPDQCHFCDYAVYKRVQQWSRYLCHRAALAAWVVPHIAAIATAAAAVGFGQPQQKITAAFGTTSDAGSGMEFGTKPLMALGDTAPPLPSETGAGPAQKSMAKIALKLFNSPDATTTTTRHQVLAETANNSYSDEHTLPGPEESTALEMRQDFATYLTGILLAEHENFSCTVKFTVKPVTIYPSDATAEDDDDDFTASSTPQRQRLKVVNRAVLIVELQQQQPASSITNPNNKNATWHENSHRKQGAAARAKSELSAPVDELVEEELAKGRLEELLQQVEARNVVTFNNAVCAKKKVTINCKATTPSPCILAAVPETTPSSYVNLADQIKTSRTPSIASDLSWRRKSPHQFMDDLNVPHDELNASMDTAARAASTIGEVPSKNRKKPKPVFELPDKLLAVDSSLSRVKPIVKSPAGLPLAPVLMVRAGTYDNTVTSALTGPFYIDDNGNLRDVFEPCSPDSDTDGDYYGDDDNDVRAQARRHEWIQTALLNRGIGERMETLLKEGSGDDDSPGDTTNLDPWEWLTGLGVCEFSRSVMKTVELYASGVGVGIVDPPSDVDQKQAAAAETRNTVAATQPTEPSVVVVGTRSPAIVKSIFSDESCTTEEILTSQPISLSSGSRPVRIPSTTVKDRHRKVLALAHDDQSREDSACDRVANNTLLLDQQDNREDSSRSHGSKESPRGVQRFDAAVSTRAENPKPSPMSTGKTMEAASSDRGEPSMVVTSSSAHAAVTPKKKNRGIKALFRRRKLDI